jgi:hypothetical protein
MVVSRRPAEGKCFVGSGTAGRKNAVLKLLGFFFAFFFLHERQHLFLPAGVHRQTAAKARSRHPSI